MATTDDIQREEATTKDYAEYTLATGIEAGQRLELQSNITRQMLGRVLPQQIVSHLRSVAKKGHRPRVCDIGTGPGHWLFDARAQLREDDINAVLDGYDIHQELFPPEEKRKAEDVSFGELNIHQQEHFIPLMKSKYDVVHVRYLSVAVGPDQWDGAVENCLSILKPGGIFVWEEILLEKMELIDPEKWTNVLRMFKLNWSILRRNDVEPKLTSLFNDNLEGVTQENFITKDLNEKWQRLQALNMSMASKELVEKAVEIGEPAIKFVGLDSAEELQEILRLTQQDFNNGAMLHMPVNRWMGVLPSSSRGSGKRPEGKTKLTESFRRWFCCK
ncbi:hypothetical protein Dda_2262 [Drechslerella dactyloides]|uniref:Methyltransferase type 12 domain-containing protein n=1 Tax=Drechslerella dactyloides TaxID=74499 RepID=A0AAD6NNR8_DREDA|nr:hypothetical protein Dda_2262 [Drechslerella dactyloides]